MSVPQVQNAVLAVRLNYHDGTALKPEHRVRFPRHNEVKDFFQLGPYASRLEEFFVIFEDPSEDSRCPAYVGEKKIAQVLTELKDKDDRTVYPTPEHLWMAVRTSRGDYAPAHALDRDVYKAVIGGFAAHVELRRRNRIIVHPFKQKRLLVFPDNLAIRVEGISKDSEEFRLTPRVLRPFPPFEQYKDLAQFIENKNGNVF